MSCFEKYVCISLLTLLYFPQTLSAGITSVLPVSNPTIGDVDINFIGGMVFVEKTYHDIGSLGFSVTVDGPTMVRVFENPITNLTGTGWDGFQWELDSSTASFVTATTAPFFSMVVNPESLQASGGVVSNGTVFGSVIDINITGAETITVLQSPSGVPVPEASILRFWTIGAIGFFSLRRWRHPTKNVRSRNRSLVQGQAG